MRTNQSFYPDGDIIPQAQGVYYTLPIGDDIFDPPRLNVEVYVIAL